MEAALSSMPIISSRVSGLQGLVIDGVTGHIVEQGSAPEVWVEKIDSYIQHPETLDLFSKEIRRVYQKEYGDKSILDFQRPLAHFVETHELSARSSAARIPRFLVSGGMGFAVQVGLLYFLTENLHLWYLLSGTLAFIFSQTTSFVLQKLWTFEDFQKDTVHYQAWLFLLTGILGVGGNALILYVCTSILGFHYIVSQVIASGLLAFLTFYIYSRHIFVSRRRTLH